jgi:hypothetical protein
LVEAEIATVHPALIRMRRLLPGARSCGLPIVLRTLRRRFSWHPGSFQAIAWPDVLREPGRLLGFDPFDWLLLIAGVLFGLLILFL